MASSGLIGPVGKCTLWRVSFIDDGHGFPSRPVLCNIPMPIPSLARNSNLGADTAHTKH